MKVLMFANMSLRIDKVSTGSWILSLLDVLNSIDNIDFAIVTTSFDKDQEFEIGNIRVKNIQQKKDIVAKIKKRLLPSIYKKEILQKYLRAVDKFNPDIIHIHGFENNFFIIKDYTEIPIVLSIQGIHNCIYNKLFAGFPFQNVIKDCKLLFYLLTKGMSKEKNLRKKSVVEKKIYKDLYYVIGQTNFDKRITYVLGGNAKYYFCNRVLRKEFYEKNWHNNFGDKLVLVSIIGNSLYKGFETIINTYKILLNMNIQVKWNIIGINHNTRINKLILNKCPLKKNIFFYNTLTVDKLISVMLSSNIFILPSHIENESTALSEALMLGMPSISSYAGGTSSYIIENEDCLIYQDGDYFALSGSVVELMKNPYRAAEMGKKARERALIRHDKDRIIKQLTDAYKDILRTEKKGAKYGK